MNFYQGRAHPIALLIKTRRIFESPSDEDGFRVLVDRLWPRGLSKKSASVDMWLKEISPSNELRRWFSHDPEKWPEFKKRYSKELGGKKESIKLLRSLEREKMKLTLLYAAKDTEHNNAVFLAGYLREKATSRPPRGSPQN